jgi:hypothetical protein
MACDLDVRPHEGVGPLRLGMTRNECRAAFGGTYDEFRKPPDNDRTTDEFLGAVHVYYDDEDRAEYIEVSRMPAVRPRFHGIALLELEPARAVAAVARHAPFDENDPELGYSYIFKPLDLSLWRPVDEENEPEGRTFMTVGVGRVGYYV